LGTSTSADTVVSATSGPAPQILTNGSVTIARDFNVLSGTGAAATFGGATAVTSTFSGNITFSQAINFSAVAGGTVYFNGTLDDRGASPLGINILGNGTIVLNGANLYTGLTTVSSGTLVANSQLAGQVIVLDGAVFTGSGATVADLNVSGGTSNISDVQSGALNVSAGTVNLASGAAATGGVNVSGGAVIVASGAQIINSDPTNVTGGLLDVNGTVAGIVNVADGGALKGSGTIGGISIGSGGTFAPGNSVGDLTVNGADVGGGATLQVNGGANVVFEFRNAVGNAPGTDWDHVDLGNGLLDLSGASPSNKITLNIDSWKFDNTGHGGGWGDGNFNQFRFDQHAVTTYEWLFLETSNIANLVGAAPGTINDYFQIIDDAVDSGVFGTGNPYTRPLDENGQQAHFTLAWKSGLQGTGLYITFTAVPEPGTMVLAGFASLGAGWYGRRRLKRAAK
jgi:autotransporter-associated beta strand protein